MDEAVASIFHTVLFHRTLGKFRYKEEGNYSVGTIGYSDVDCDFIDFTYVSFVIDQNLTLIVTVSHSHRLYVCSYVLTLRSSIGCLVDSCSS